MHYAFSVLRPFTKDLCAVIFRSYVNPIFFSSRALSVFLIMKRPIFLIAFVCVL